MNQHTKDDINTELRTIKEMVDAALERARIPKGTQDDLLRIRECASRAAMALALAGTPFEPEVA
jgi:hypothetical protein